MPILCKISASFKGKWGKGSVFLLQKIRDQYRPAGGTVCAGQIQRSGIQEINTFTNLCQTNAFQQDNIGT